MEKAARLPSRVTAATASPAEPRSAAGYSGGSRSRRRLRRRGARRARPRSARRRARHSTCRPAEAQVDDAGAVIDRVANRRRLVRVAECAARASRADDEQARAAARPRATSDGDAGAVAVEVADVTAVRPDVVGERPRRRDLGARGGRRRCPRPRSSAAARRAASIAGSHAICGRVSEGRSARRHGPNGPSSASRAPVASLRDGGSRTQRDPRGPRGKGAASVETGLPVLDRLLERLARVRRVSTSLSRSSPARAEAEVAEAGSALGRALAGPLRARRRTRLRLCLDDLGGGARERRPRGLGRAAARVECRPHRGAHRRPRHRRRAPFPRALRGRSRPDAARAPPERHRHAARARGDLQGAGRRPCASVRATKEERVADKTVVRTESAPAPFQGAPYSQAIAANGFVFVSGQLALKPGDKALSGGTIEEQTEQVFANLARDPRGGGLGARPARQDDGLPAGPRRLPGHELRLRARTSATGRRRARRSRSRSSRPGRSSRSRRSPSCSEMRDAARTRGLRPLARARRVSRRRRRPRRAARRSTRRTRTSSSRASTPKG